MFVDLRNRREQIYQNYTLHTISTATRTIYIDVIYFT
jgi:hypothetical protein